jgi:hypothetical protein
MAGLFVFPNLLLAETSDLANEIDPNFKVEVEEAVPLTIQGVEEDTGSPTISFFPGSALSVIGTLAWNLIKSGEPMSGHNFPKISVLPKGAEDWSLYEGWKPGRAFIYHVKYNNYMGVEVVDYSFRVTYMYDGKRNGVGSYLSNVSVSPAELKVLWGFKLESHVTVQDAYNLGTVENPVAGVDFVVSWSLRSLIKQVGGSLPLSVKGTGEIAQTQL